MWTRGIEPRPRVFQTRALPLEPVPPDFHSSAASGNRTHDLSVDNRTLCLSELWRRFLSLVTGHWLLVPRLLSRRVKDSNLRPSSCPGSALAPRRLRPLGQPSSYCYQAEGEGLEPPRTPWATAVFETAA